jgi:hypothetical protein
MTTDQDRGAYTPPTDRLAFDPREPVRSGPAPVTLIVSGLILVGLIGGVAFVYRHGTRHPGATPSQVGEPVTDMKAATPPDTNAASGLSVQKVAANAMPNFAPPPEEPGARSSQSIASLPAANSAPLPVVTITQPPPPSKAATQTTATSTTTQTTTTATTPKPAKTLAIASLANDAVSKPLPRPKPLTESPPVTTAAEPAGAGWVQIGAFSSPSLSAAGWNDIAKLQPAAMKGKARKVETVSAGGKTLYRTYITGFASKPAAQAFCDKLKAAGKSCIVK